MFGEHPFPDVITGRASFAEFRAKRPSHSLASRVQDGASRDNLTLNDRNNTLKVVYEPRCLLLRASRRSRGIFGLAFPMGE